MEAAFAKVPAMASRLDPDLNVQAARPASDAGGSLFDPHAGTATPAVEPRRPQRNRMAAPSASPQFEASLRLLTEMGFEAGAARAALGKVLGRVEAAVEILSRAAPPGQDEAASAAPLAADASAAGVETRCRVEKRPPGRGSDVERPPARGSGDARRETLETSRTAPALNHPDAEGDTAQNAAPGMRVGQGLASGGVEALWRNDSRDAPVRVQLIGVTQLGASTGAVRYRVCVSDGRHSVSAGLVTKLNPLVSAGHARMHSLVEIGEWERLAVHGKPALLLKALYVVRQCEGVLGSPTPLAETVAADPVGSRSQATEGEGMSMASEPTVTPGAHPAGAPAGRAPAQGARAGALAGDEQMPEGSPPGDKDMAEGAQAEDQDMQEGEQAEDVGGSEEAVLPVGTGGDASLAAPTDARTEDSPCGTVVLEEVASAPVTATDPVTATAPITAPVTASTPPMAESEAGEHVPEEAPAPELRLGEEAQPVVGPMKRKRTVVVKPKATRASTRVEDGAWEGVGARAVSCRRASAARMSGVSAGVVGCANGGEDDTRSTKKAEKKRASTPRDEVTGPRANPGPRSQPAAPRVRSAPPCLALSAGISKREAEALVASAAFLGATSGAGKDGGLPAGCTHVLIPDSASALPLCAYFAAASGRVWVVRAEWLFRSLEAGGWIEETPFEATHLGAVREARLAAAPSLAGKALCLWQGTALPHPVLRALAMAAGATVVHSPRVAHYLITDEAAYTSGEGESDPAAGLPAKLPAWLSRALREGGSASAEGVWHKPGLPSVATTKWLLDCICPGTAHATAPVCGGGGLGASGSVTEGVAAEGIGEDRSTAEGAGAEDVAPRQCVEDGVGATQDPAAAAGVAATAAAGVTTGPSAADVEEMEEDCGDDGELSDEF
jgi:hypothetical protein